MSGVFRQGLGGCLDGGAAVSALREQKLRHVEDFYLVSSLSS